jgi:hypothetical protein
MRSRFAASADLVPAVRLYVLEEQVEPPRLGVDAFLVLEDQIAEPEDGRIFGDPVLHPLLVEERVLLEPNLLRLHIVEVFHPRALP